MRVNIICHLRLLVVLFVFFLTYYSDVQGEEISNRNRLYKNVVEKVIVKRDIGGQPRYIGRILTRRKRDTTNSTSQIILTTNTDETVKPIHDSTVVSLTDDDEVKNSLESAKQNNDNKISESKDEKLTGSSSIADPSLAQNLIPETERENKFTPDSDSEQNSIGQIVPEVKPARKLDSESYPSAKSSDRESMPVKNSRNEYKTAVLESGSDDESDRDSNSDKLKTHKTNSENNREDTDVIRKRTESVVEVKIETPETEISKVPGPHLSSSKHDERVKNMQLAQNYANILSSSFFGQPFDVGADEDAPTLFTVANSDVGRPWSSIPYREKFQWFREDAPCFTFNISIPDERTGHGQLPICIFRQHLEYKEESSLIIHQEEKHFNVYEQRERKVSGQVKDMSGSAVYGRFVDTYFYGEISMKDPDTGEQTVYVVEEIKLLSRLLHHSHKLVNNLLTVMQNASKKNSSEGMKFNAVVTKGVSILSFMSNPDPNPEALSRSFVILSTSQNSYITSGEPLAKLDENGRLIFTTRGNVVTIDTDESVKLKTRQKEYTFRPRGKTMVSEGMNAEALRQLEGVVVITAITKAMTYSCVLPSPSFTHTRQGGFLCKVCLAADNSFREHYLEKLGINGTVSNFLGQAIDKVSWIFRSVDWNRDNRPDNVGLDYDLQYHHWNSPVDDGNEEVTTDALEVMFGSLATVDFSDCCLGISFTMKKFPPAIFAKSSQSKPMAPGGACAIRNDGVSNNAILISANSKEGNFSALTEDQLVYLTAREVAKAFGATADTSGQAGCDSFVDKSGKSRHYLLWPDVMREITSEEKSFSTCSQKSIFEALSSCKSSCFDVDHHPFCGNGIQEEGEECDCGNEHDCSLQLCCYGRSGKFPCRKTGAPCKTGNFATSITLESSAFLFVTLTWIRALVN